jgi:NAD-dependent DNA ligase
MNMSDEYKALRILYVLYSHHYYCNDISLVSDFCYDSLEKRLEIWEEAMNIPLAKRLTQKVGSGKCKELHK